MGQRGLADVISGKWRVAVFALLFFGLWVLPFGRQVAGQRWVPAVKWQMYAGKNLDVCLLNARTRDGHEAIEWAQRRTGRRMFPLTDVLKRDHTTDRVVEKLCQQNAGNVEVQVRCAHRARGFKTYVDWDRPICENPRIFGGKNKKRKRR